MSFYADLHLHSKFSRATSREATLEHYALAARKKGVSLLGTGDFTHPTWLAEIRDKLVPAEEGLFRLRPDLEREVDQHLPRVLQGTAPARFMLTVEISTIYKRDGAVRKVHHVVAVPDPDAAARLVTRLSRIGNLAADGRPILGLDARHLLEITLECGPLCFLIPAHLWTPWFSALGAQSGFDSLEECYGELALEVFAAETGLSSDPPMNWRVSRLDRLRLVSSSDAHSPAKLAREACVFDTQLSYPAVREALRTGAGYAGTVEFFPEEGKYHLDGHRKCGVRLTPEETRQHQGRCPVCGRPVTVGVMHRVEALADRPAGSAPPGVAPCRWRIPLAEMLAELYDTAPDSRAVGRACEALISRVGPELYLLDAVPLEELRRVGPALLAEAVDRMRQGRVFREAGYDGEYGRIRLFQPEELRELRRGGMLLEIPPAPATVAVHQPEAVPETLVAEEKAGLPTPLCVRETTTPDTAGDNTLDAEQRAAVAISHGPLLIVAGPGTGKTRTLTHRIARLVREVGVPPEQCLAITFTNRAAEEMRDRLRRLVPAEAPRIPVLTFHGLGGLMLREQAERLELPADFRIADEAEACRVAAAALGLGERAAARALAELRRQQRLAAPLPPAARAYEAALRARGLVDFDDLIRLPVELLERDAAVRESYQARYRWISVDEYQDIDALQYRLLRQLAPADANLCVIGDPDQAIYGFRGADVRFFQRFTDDYPGAEIIRLGRNYRSGRCIVEAAQQVIAPASLVSDRTLIPWLDEAERLVVHAAPTDRAEAEFVVHTIEQLVGGSGFFSRDSSRVTAEPERTFAFADIAVLYRTDQQAAVLAEALHRSGMPYQRRSHERLAELPVVQTLLQTMASLLGELSPGQRLEAALAAAKGDTGQLPDEATVGALRTLAAASRDMTDFADRLALAADVDLWDPRADRVSLLTLHAAKGLEFPVVFITGCEDGLLPLTWGRDTDNVAEPDEERRLFFVGMTRARCRLFLTHVRRRYWRGAWREMQPSPFLAEIKEHLLERRGSAVPRPRRDTDSQMELF